MLRDYPEAAKPSAVSETLYMYGSSGTLISLYTYIHLVPSKSQRG